MHGKLQICQRYVRACEPLLRHEYTVCGRSGGNFICYGWSSNMLSRCNVRT